MAHELRRAGYRHAYAMVGGWDAYQDAGLPVEPQPLTADA